jgi:hypothetical protein
MTKMRYKPNKKPRGYNRRKQNDLYWIATQGLSFKTRLAMIKLINIVARKLMELYSKQHTSESNNTDNTTTDNNQD